MRPARRARSCSPTTRCSNVIRGFVACLGVLAAFGLAEAQAPAETSPEEAARAASRRRPLGETAEIAIEPRGEPVGLEELLRHAEEHATAVRVARARLGLGDAAMAGARPILPGNPVVYGNVGPRIREEGNGIDFQASISQPIEIAGERRRRRVAATRTQERVQAELDAVRWQTHWEIHAAFHNALVERDRLRAVLRLVAFQERLLEIAENRLRIGETGPLPVRIAEGETAQARVAAIAANQAYSAALLRLAELAGWPSDRPLDAAGEIETPREAPPLETIRELARRNQPTARVLAAALGEARAERRLADREAFPEPALGVQVGQEDEGGGTQPDRIVVGTLAFELPLFQRNQRARAEARAAVDIADAEAAAFGRRLELVLARSKSAVDAAARRSAIYGAEVLPAFERNLEMIQTAYELGEIDILEVSVARERFIRLQSDALAAYLEYFQAVASLESVVGADLWPEEHH